MWPELQRRLFNSLSQPTLCNADSGDGGGGGDGGGDKKFTQTEFNAALAKERKTWEAKSKEAVARAKEEAEKATAELKEEFDKFKQEQEDATLSAEAKVKKAAERAQNTLIEKLKNAEAEKKVAVEIATQATATLKDERVAQYLGAALQESNVHQPAFSEAVRSFKALAQVELDDNGKLTTVALGDKSYTDPKEAAKEFLKDRPFFEKGAAGGGGTNPPNAGGGSGKPLHEQTDQELFEAAKIKP